MTIEDLKKHCIKTIKMSEAIESISNVRVTDNRSLQEHKMVLKLIEAWEKVREIFKAKSTSEDWEYIHDLQIWEDALEIIDKHLSEVSE
jgi:hypothetical protein